MANHDEGEHQNSTDDFESIGANARRLNGNNINGR